MALQRVVRVGSATFYMDRYIEALKLDFELDGAAYHGLPGQRERDIRRDTVVATQGIQTVRFSHRRLFNEPARVADDALAVVLARCAQLGSRYESLLP